MKWRGVAAGGLAVGLAAAVAGAGGFDTAEGGVLPSRRVWHVLAAAPHQGDGSASRPFKTIEEGLAVAQPGQIVLVHNGTYRTQLRTVRPGQVGAPIRIIGGGATVIGGSGGRTVQILHNYVTLEGMRVTGGDSLVWVQGATGVRLLNNILHGAGGECVRLKHFARGNEVARNRITDCGRKGFDLAAGKKNGEGVYIGTAPEQLFRNPDRRPDASDGNWVHNNVIQSRAECVDVKEAASRNVVSRNTCTDGKDPDGAGFSSRGRLTWFLGNTVHNHAGAGIRLGGDGASDGTGNQVQQNQLRGTIGYGIKVQRLPQAEICGNVLGDNRQGKTNGPSDPTAPC